MPLHSPPHAVSHPPVVLAFLLLCLHMPSLSLQDRPESMTGMAQTGAPVNFDGFTYVAPSAVKAPATAATVAVAADDSAVDSDWCEVSAQEADDGDVDTSADIAV